MFEPVNMTINTVWLFVFGCLFAVSGVCLAILANDSLVLLIVASTDLIAGTTLLFSVLLIHLSQRMNKI